MEVKASTPQIDKDDIRKILVKCPEGAEKAFATFPFLIALSEEFPSSEILLISEESDSLAYRFLPFKLKAFERPSDKKTLLKTHQFCANLDDVFNIDLFFDLENNFNSSFMGFNFRSTHRIGYETGFNKYFLTKKFRNEEAFTLEKKCIRLLEMYCEKHFSELLIARSKESGQPSDTTEKLFAEPESPSFIMIMLDNLVNVTKQIDMWKDFFDSFQGQKFIIWSLKDENQISELFAKIDLGHNELFMHSGNDSKELMFVMNKVKGIVLNNLWAEGLSTFLGHNSISLLTHEPAMLPRYDYFKFKPQRFVFATPKGPIRYSYLQEERDYSSMNQIVDFLHFQLKL